MGPGTAYAGIERSPGNAAGPSAKAVPPATPYQQVVQPPSQPATPYQQAVQPPRRPVGRGVAAQSPSNRATPAAGQTIPDHGRPQPGDRVSEADQSVAPGMGEGWQPMFPQLPHREPHNPNQAIVQGPGALTRPC